MLRGRREAHITHRKLEHFINSAFSLNKFIVLGFLFTNNFFPIIIIPCPLFLNVNDLMTSRVSGLYLLESLLNLSNITYKQGHPFPSNTSMGQRVSVNFFCPRSGLTSVRINILISNFFCSCSPRNSTKFLLLILVNPGEFFDKWQEPPEWSRLLYLYGSILSSWASPLTGTTFSQHSSPFLSNKLQGPTDPSE